MLLNLSKSFIVMLSTSDKHMGLNLTQAKSLFIYFWIPSKNVDKIEGMWFLKGIKRTFEYSCEEASQSIHSHDLVVYIISYYSFFSCLYKSFNWVGFWAELFTSLRINSARVAKRITFAKAPKTFLCSGEIFSANLNLLFLRRNSVYYQVTTNQLLLKQNLY